MPFSQSSSGGSGGKGGDQGEYLEGTPVTCTQRQEQTLRGLDRIRVAAHPYPSQRLCVT